MTLLATLNALLIQPFAEFGFLRRALVGCIAVSLSAPPLGVYTADAFLRDVKRVGACLLAAARPSTPSTHATTSTPACR